MRKWIMSACALAWLALALTAVTGLRGPSPARASGTAVSSNASTTATTSSASTSAATSNPAASNPGTSAATSSASAGSPGADRAGGAAPVTTAGATQVTLASVSAALDAAAPAARQPSGPARWTVRPGDTLSGIAAALGLRGGWPVLYAANKTVIGPDPNVIHAGTVLAVPGATPPARYTVAPGDTLSAIAAALGLRGGWPVLYAADKTVIGPDPNVIHAGTVLTAPPPAAAGRVPRQQAPSASQPGRAPAPSGTSRPAGAAPQAPSGSQPVGQAASAAPPNPAAGRATAPGQAATPPNTAAPGRTAAPGQAAAPGRAGASAPAAPAGGMPRWLQDTLLAAGVLAATAFAAEPAAALARRRRNSPGAPRPAPNTPAAPSAPRRDSARRAAAQAARKASITLADHERLIVTYSAADHAVYVLTPPGEDPAAVLRAARLVLPEDTYEDLAGHLGVPSGWPLE